jgi:general secretion pathway protein J
VRGFTLIEVMIALMVFAVLGTITSMVLSHAFDTRARVNAKEHQLEDLQLALTLISRDTTQIIERSSLGNNLRQFPPFVGLPTYIEFTRGGLDAQAYLKESSLKRVAYHCKDSKLIRESFKQLDTPNRAQHQSRIVLDNLEQCSFAYLSASRQVLTEWRAYALAQNQKKETLPSAIQFSFTIKGMGNMVLVYIIPGALYAA